MSSSTSDLDFFYFRIVALLTGLPFLSIDFQRVLKSSRLMIAGKGSDCGPIVFYSIVNNYFSPLDNVRNLTLLEFRHIFLRMNSGCKQNLIDINVPCSTNKFLIE